jgi:hypothetical protein
MRYLKVYPKVKGQSNGKKRPLLFKHRVALNRDGYVCTGRGWDQLGHYLVAEEPEGQDGLELLYKRGFNGVSYVQGEPRSIKRYGSFSRFLASIF